MKEVGMGRISGPFSTAEETGLDSLIISPIGLVPKPSGGERLIHHLSHPWGSGVNAYIDDEEARVSYASFDQALKIVASYGVGAAMAKLDVKSAYRLLPMRESDFRFLGFHIQGTVFVDKMAPMGAKISASHWEAFGRLWEWLINQRPDFRGATCRYMDDLLIVCHPQDPNPSGSVQSVIQLSNEIGLPLAEEKTVFPTTEITFLGLIIDSVTQAIKIPGDKQSAICEMLHKLLNVRNTKVRKLLSLAGKLNFICKAIPAGRPFMRRLFDSVKGHAKHEWVKVTCEMKQDFEMWLTFLRDFNGHTKFPPLVLPQTPDIDLFTDASLQGYGIVCGRQWVMQPFPKFEKEPSMTWRELYPILVALHVFRDKLCYKRVCFNTDNTGVFHILHTRTSPVPELMDLIRPITLQALHLNIAIATRFVPTDQNILADPLSRLSPQVFRARAPQAEALPTPIPPHLRFY